jgi:soluble lytic murein transglycosylase
MRTISTSLAFIVAVTLASAAGSNADAVSAPIVAEEPGRDTIVSLVREHRRYAPDHYHQSLADVIYDAAVSAEVDPLLVASIVAKESSFVPSAVSSKGALGLMQLAPFVAEDVSNRSDVAWNGVKSLESPEVNVKLGILYYKELVERFDGDAQKALTAYNFGPTRVAKQLREGTYRGSRYAREVLDLHSRLVAGSQIL